MTPFFMVFLSTLLVSASGYADTWGNPEIRNYYCSNGKYYVKVYPLKTPAKYYKWMQTSVRRKRKFNPSDTLLVPCFAKLYKVKVDRDSLIWERQLSNRVAPQTAILSNDGRFLVTFDNWGSLGFGTDVMAYYNDKGELIKKHSLEDISPFPINNYKRTISSILWKCGTSFIDNERIEVCFRDAKNLVARRSVDLINHTMEKYNPLVPD